ncbi:MAG: hypothetical protein AAF800_14910, partial [Planctomycetota bacterium]
MTLAAGLNLVGCGEADVSGEGPSPQSVGVVELSLGVPRTETLVAGVVEPYRRSDLSFDIAGLVGSVIDLGEEAQGPQLDGSGSLLLGPDGEPVREGTPIATLDATRFRQAVAAAELAL